MKFLFSIAIACCTIYACNITGGAKKTDLLFSNIDSTVKPGEDFFKYANGGWIKRNPIPADQYGESIGLQAMEENLKRLRDISEKAAISNAANGSTDQKIGDFWREAMDSTKIESSGIIPIQPLLDKLNAVSDIKTLISTIADFKKIGLTTLFNDYISQDARNSDVMAYYLWQGDLGLPEREYYFKSDSATINIRNQYVKHIAEILKMVGEDPTAAAIAAKNILVLEKKLATASRKIEDLRDPYKNYNIMAISDLKNIASNIDWASYLKIMDVNNLDSVIVGQPDYFNALNEALTNTPITDWKNYVKFNLIINLAGVLPDSYGIEVFNFQKLFSGIKERKPRWKRAIEMEESAMGELLGQLYVKEFFNETTKKRYSEMVEAFKDAMKNRISKLAWMGDSTKEKALKKLAAMKFKIGYPDKWKDFSAMEIGKESLVKNYLSSRLWWHNYNFSKLGKAVNKDEWFMFPQTYSAYYDASINQIILPAGIFTVPGYRDEELDDALVYGYGGASTIGHEFTHSFDDVGRQFDEKGNLVNWWTKSDEAEFTKRADVLVKQFNDIEPIKGYHINGKATLGENIADLGGILLGIEAFKKTKQFKENNNISNLTPMQRYFLGYALSYAGYPRDEQLRRILLIEVHSPSKYRVNGIFVNVDEFYTTFSIKPGDKMYKPDSLRVRIW